MEELVYLRESKETNVSKVGVERGEIINWIIKMIGGRVGVLLEIESSDLIRTLVFSPRSGQESTNQY